MLNWLPLKQLHLFFSTFDTFFKQLITKNKKNENQKIVH